MTTKRSSTTQRMAVVACLLTAASVSAMAQTQTCRPGIPRVAPDARYGLSDPLVVTDTVTGLVWKRCPEGRSGAGCATGSTATMSWSNALNAADAANVANYAGHADWRLPNIIELRSLVESGCYDPAINTNVFPQNGASIYWSSTAYAFGAGDAWVVNFVNGFLYANNYVNNFVRLVRGGQGLAPLMDIIFANGFEAAPGR